MNPSPVSPSKKAHLTHIREYYERQTSITKAAEDYREILARYYNLLIPETASVLEVGCGSGELLARLHGNPKCGVDLSPAQIKQAKEKIPSAEFYVQAGEELNLPDRTFDYIVLSETLNLAADVQLILERLKALAASETRLIINVYNALWRPLIALATALGLRDPHPESNWLVEKHSGRLAHVERVGIDSMRSPYSLSDQAVRVWKTFSIDFWLQCSLRFVFPFL